MFRNLLIKAALSDQNSDLSEVYTYAASFNITPQQVDAALADKPAIIREKLIAWKYLLHSLVDTGYTPWLKGDGVAYINSQIRPTRTDVISYKVKIFETTANSAWFGMRESGSYNSYDYNQIYLGKNKKSYLFTYGYKTNLYVKSVEVGDIYTESVDLSNYIPAGNTYTKPYFIFSMNNIRSAYAITQNAISYLNINAHCFVPYLDNGSYGMLDLVTGTFYSSAAPNGLFTYILEDVNGNQVNIN